MYRVECNGRQEPHTRTVSESTRGGQESHPRRRPRTHARRTEALLSLRGGGEEGEGRRRRGAGGERGGEGDQEGRVVARAPATEADAGCGGRQKYAGVWGGVTPQEAPIVHGWGLFRQWPGHEKLGAHTPVVCNRLESVSSPWGSGRACAHLPRRNFARARLG